MRERIGYRLRPIRPQPPQPVAFSHLDLSQLNVPLPCLFIYKNDNPASAPFMPTDALLAGLQRAVDMHPVLYGRLGHAASGLPEIQPSTEGVRIYVADVAYPIAAFDGSWSHATTCRGLGVPTWLVTEQKMLFGAKITRFAGNTGVAIAIVQHHYCVDIYSLVKFIGAWASFVRGETPEAPLLDRTLLRGHPRPPASDCRQALASVMPLAKPSAVTCIGAMLRISAANIAALKAVVAESLPTLNGHSNNSNDDDIAWVSTANALGALLYRARLRATQRPPDAPCHLGYPVNLRFLFPDLVPRNYFGNALVSATVTSTAGDILGRPIGHLAARLRQAGNAFTRERIADKIDELAALLAAWPPSRETHQYILGTDCCYSDWTKFELQSLDFGQGHPICVRSPRTAPISPTCLLRNMLPGQDGMEVYLVDDSVHIARMKQDKELLAYFEWIG
ncbi:transferase [Syncephalis pseudoplumigaleata]|uniref:Transferase n=1 Tax=Syncephalis pseudoplumigaleata TaxID=1712513 RepID=A0A4P9Z207_9FUNG|nr:transferase [Syncephalis pseudoplumigaleata]|eukprot:RKP26504.1 transferase [Syncephalis pseudoplumigaleata]